MEAAGPAPDFDAARPAVLESHFLKGQSKRIWGELYKVLDSSDVVIQVSHRSCVMFSSVTRVDEDVYCFVRTI